MEERLTLYHYQQDVDTISDFMEQNHIKGINASELFDQNREAIFNQLSTDQKASLSKSAGREITKDDIDYTMTLPKPCVLSIESKYVVRELAISQTNFQENLNDIYAFENSYIQSIIQNEGYVIDASTKKKNIRCNVWGWFKSVNNLQGTEANKFNNDEERFMDLSDFIISLDTNVSASGGNFTIVLPIISTTEYIRKKGAIWYRGGKIENMGVDIVKTTVMEFKEMNSIVVGDRSIVHKSGIANSSCDNYFNWLIQSNDLVFISFERMQIEEEGTVFDMIGLVESVVVNLEADGNGRVTVSGKDLMKLITDDNSLFFNTSTAWGENQIFADSDGNIGDMRSIDVLGGNYNPYDRLRRSTNEIDIFATPFNKTISFIIKGVISQLANIRIVPDYVFDSWKNRTEFSKLEYEDNSTNLNSGENNDDGEIELNKDFNKR